MPEIAIKIVPGGEVFFLYSDDSPLRGMGKMELIRASNVEWDEMAQRWFIRMPSGNLIGKMEGYEKRMAAIIDEVHILSQMLIDGATMPELGFKK
jgi:hypothetical protein